MGSDSIRKIGDLSSDVKYRLLLQISEKISGTLELEEILNHLLDTVRLVVAYDAAGIFVLRHTGLPLGEHDESDLIAAMATRGFDASVPGRDPMLRAGRGIVGWVIRTGKSEIVSDVDRDSRYVQGRRQTRSEMAVPIILNKQIIGALNLESDQVGAFTGADVEMLQFFANAAGISIEKAMLYRQMLERNAITRQLTIAREVQASLLPDASPVLHGYQIAAVNLPTFEIGGDYYDYIPFSNGHLGIAVADVSGKGIPAALIMATFRAALRTQVRNDFELPHIMHSVNHLLTESIGITDFVTAVYGILDPAAGTYVYSNAGHNPPFLLRGQETVEVLDHGGPALGVFDEAKYETSVVSMQPGDLLVLYTDGVVEVADSGEREYGLQRLQEVVRRASSLGSNEVIQEVVADTQSFSGKEAYQDDFTLVIVKRMPSPS